MSTHCFNYACHRLIDEHRRVHHSSVVQVGKAGGQVCGYVPFNHEEQPFTQWIGGTILLTTETRPPLAQGECLGDYLHKRANSPDMMSQSTAPLYAWHTPFTDNKAPLAHPPTLLPSPFIIHNS